MPDPIPTVSVARRDHRIGGNAQSRAPRDQFHKLLEIAARIQPHCGRRLTI